MVLCGIPNGIFLSGDEPGRTALKIIGNSEDMKRLEQSEQLEYETRQALPGLPSKGKEVYRAAVIEILRDYLDEDRVRERVQRLTSIINSV